MPAWCWSAISSCRSTALRERLRGFVGRGVRGHLMQVTDPAEWSLPFAGRVQFEDLESHGRALIGNVDGVRERYRARLQSASGRSARALPLAVLDHRQPQQRSSAGAGAARPLHHALDQGPGLGDARSGPARPDQPLAADRAAQPAGAVVAAAGDPAGAAAPALSDDPLPARPAAGGGDLGAHAALAAGAAAPARHPVDPGARRAGAQPRAGAVGRGAAGPGGGRRLGGSAAVGAAHRRPGALHGARPAAGARGDPARHGARSGRIDAAARERRRCGGRRLGLAAQALAGRPCGRAGPAPGRDDRRCRDRLAERRDRGRARRARRRQAVRRRAATARPAAGDRRPGRSARGSAAAAGDRRGRPGREPAAAGGRLGARA